MNFNDQNKLVKTFEFFDMAAVESMAEYSNDLERLVDADAFELHKGRYPKLEFGFTRMAMDSNGYHVGSETCVVTFKSFDARHLMYVNPLIKRDYKMHGIGITFDLHDAEFTLTPAREEIPWEEIWRENADPEHKQLLDEYKASLYSPAFVNQDVAEPIDEEDFCAWMQEKHGIEIDREAYFDAYYPPDEDFWYQELEDRFDKLKQYLKNLRWKFNPDHQEQEVLPWTIVESEPSVSS